MGSRVKTSAEDLYSVSYDGLKVSGSPQALVEISDEKEVGSVLKLANEFVFQLLPEGLGQA